MYMIRWNGRYEVFDSLIEAEEFREMLFNKGKIDSTEDLEIMPYHWTMA